MGLIVVTDLEGGVHELEAVEGWPVMNIIRDWGLPMEGLCGGACDCATCHVFVDPLWLPRLFPQRPDEIEKLDELPLVLENSRLSCQIIWTEELDGLALTLATPA